MTFLGERVNKIGQFPGFAVPRRKLSAKSLRCAWLNNFTSRNSDTRNVGSVSLICILDQLDGSQFLTLLKPTCSSATRWRFSHKVAHLNLAKPRTALFLNTARQPRCDSRYPSGYDALRGVVHLLLASQQPGEADGAQSMILC